MKTHIFVLGFILAFVQIQAQVPQQKVLTTAQKSFPKHEVNLGYGEPFSASLFIYQGDVWGGLDIVGRFYGSYQYRLKKWLSIGGVFTYNPYHIHYDTKIYNLNGVTIDAKTKYSKLYGSVLSIAAEVRFIMFSRNWVILYGGGALGYSAEFSQNNAKNNISTYFRNAPYWQVTLFGFSFGKNIIFGGEIGAGSKGILNAYIGYKF